MVEINIGEEPKQLLLRRHEVIAWLGIPYSAFDSMVKGAILPWKRIRRGGVRVYRKEDVKRVFLEGFRVTGE